MYRFNRLILFAAIAANAQILQDRFIVEFDSAASAAPQTGTLARKPSPASESFRKALENRGGTVLDTFSLFDGYAVQTSLDRAALEAMPGVRKVYPDYMVYPLLDAAVNLVKAKEAFARIGGMERAGAGMKIAIVDSGIDHDHPGLSDASLSAPAGYPKGTRDSDYAGVNSKVIVARAYSAPTPADYSGHGTGVAMAAAGRAHQAPVGELSGVAPRAYLGNYKVFPDSPNAGASASTIVRAIEDAANDGMDVINLSLGSTPAANPSFDVVTRAVERVAARGIVVVTAAGNAGSDIGTLSTLAAGSPWAIAVGATTNSRALGGGLLAYGESYRGIPGDTSPGTPVSGPIADIAALGNDGLGCDALPPDSLTGKIALIARGTCFFENKLNNAQKAGAIAAVLYTDDRPVGTWTAGTARLPAMMISNQEGLALKAKIANAPDAIAELRFGGVSIPSTPGRVTGFSSRGPAVYDLLKPDLSAPGANFYTAAQSLDSRGELYNANGYTSTSGTSFSSPLVAGAAAVIKSLRPSLGMSEVRSILINTAAPLDAPLRDAGAGQLDLEAAVQARAAVSPAALYYGAGNGDFNAARELTITNIGNEPETFSFQVEPSTPFGAPDAPPATLRLQPGESRPVNIRWFAAGLGAGEHWGFLIVRGASNPVPLRVPYWYGVRDQTPRYISILEDSTSTPRAGLSFRFYVRVGDASGLAMMDTPPTVTVAAGLGSVVSVSSSDAAYPGMWRVEVRLDNLPVLNSFRVAAGSISQTVEVSGR